MWRRSRHDDTHDDTEAEIVLLAVAQSEVEGQMWAGALRDAGIHVLMKAGGPGMGAWAPTGVFEQHLYVVRGQLEKARDILGPGAVPVRTHTRSRRHAPRVNRRSRRRSG